MGIRQKPQDGIREGAGHLPRRRPQKRGGCGEARQHDDKSTLAGHPEAIARETPAGSLSVASMPQRKDYANDAEHHGKFQVWLQVWLLCRRRLGTSTHMRTSNSTFIE